MVVYEYGNVKKKKKKLPIIMLVIVVVLLAVLAGFGGVWLAKDMHEKELAKLNETIGFAQDKENNVNEENVNVANVSKPAENNSQEKTNSQANNVQTNTNDNKQTAQNTQANEVQTSSNKNTTTSSSKGSSSSSTSSSNNTTSNKGSTNSSSSNTSSNKGSSSSNSGSSTSSSKETTSQKATNITGLTDKQWSALSNIYSSKEKRAFLTFDDGPSSTITPRILDTLKKENIKATFFVLGTMVKSNPDLVKREKAEGHFIANHGYSHVYSQIYSKAENALEEYKKTNKIIQQALGDSTYQSTVFRFPGGSSGGYYDSMKTKAKKILKQNKVAYLDWNCLTNDAAGATTKTQILNNLKATCNSNSIVVLMHDAPNKKLTADTLPDVIAYLRKKGYKFMSIGDII